ncbi:MAG: PulJ/GspJ family protein [Planctomycetota bacterium]|jgi:hypothetical protein
MPCRRRKIRSGVNIIEVVITMVISTMLASGVGVLLVSGQRAWHKTYNSANERIKQDAYDIMVRFSSMARRANRLDYIIYDITDGVFTPAGPVTADVEEVVSGDAVEFRYWDVELDQEDTHELMDVTKMATAYVLFYIDGNRLKVDYGPYPPGAVPEGGGAKNSTGVITTVLAENASAGRDNDAGAFSHTTLNGVGQGCVRINLILTDAEDEDSIEVRTAATMRNIWPR